MLLENSGQEFFKNQFLTRRIPEVEEMAGAIECESVDGV